MKGVNWLIPLDGVLLGITVKENATSEKQFFWDVG